jgi:hypothetical protein
MGLVSTSFGLFKMPLSMIRNPSPLKAGSFPGSAFFWSVFSWNPEKNESEDL